MKYKNSLKIIFTILVALSALIVFACQSSTTDNSANSARTSDNSGKTNNPATNATLSEDRKPPTMTDYPVGNAQSPSEAYRMLFAAVKSQDTAKIKLMFSQKSIGLAEMQAGRSNQPVEKVYANGFSETTFADNMPQIRDERIKEDSGAVEVWNEKRKTWEDIPFIKEGGSWKAAFGDAFAGTWKSPGKGQAIIEQENINASQPKQVPQNPMANSNANFTNPKRVDKSSNK